MLMKKWKPPSEEEKEKQIQQAVQVLRDDINRLWADRDWIYVPSFWDEEEQHWDDEEYWDEMEA